MWGPFSGQWGNHTVSPLLLTSRSRVWEKGRPGAALVPQSPRSFWGLCWEEQELVKSGGKSAFRAPGGHLCPQEGKDYPGTARQHLSVFPKAI